MLETGDRLKIFHMLNLAALSMWYCTYFYNFDQEVEGGMEKLATCCRSRRLKWFGHVNSQTLAKYIMQGVGEVVNKEWCPKRMAIGVKPRRLKEAHALTAGMVRTEQWRHITSINIIRSVAPPLFLKARGKLKVSWIALVPVSAVYSGVCSTMHLWCYVSRNTTASAV